MLSTLSSQQKVRGTGAGAQPLCRSGPRCHKAVTKNGGSPNQWPLRIKLSCGFARGHTASRTQTACNHTCHPVCISCNGKKNHKHLELDLFSGCWSLVQTWAPARKKRVARSREMRTDRDEELQFLCLPSERLSHSSFHSPSFFSELAA